VTLPATLAWCGGGALAVGAGFYVYVELMPPYAGASGGGLAGVTAGLLVLTALVLGGLGIVLLMAAGLLAWRRRIKAS
jgi:hypothetical protein